MMVALRSSRRRLTTEIERFPLKHPFHIAGHTMFTTDVVVVTLEQDGCIGRGEATGMYYRKDDDAPAIMRHVEGVRSAIESGIDRSGLNRLLGACGARNALDCALWDLDAKLAGCPVWQLAGIDLPHALVTTFTIGADKPPRMRADALAYSEARAIKIKLTGDPVDAERIRAVREARPDVWLGVDGNQGFTKSIFDALMPVFVDCDVALIEQPLPVGQEMQLRGMQSPIPIAADESVLELADLAKLVGLFQCINIKLDKCGGLTEGLAMARKARELGLDAMVGNTIGTSLSMAPAFLIGQLCTIVDLDGPMLMEHDRVPGVTYEKGMIGCPDKVWGAA